MLPNSPYTPTVDDFTRFEERLVHTVETQLVQRRRRHRAIVAASVVVLVAGGGATAWVTLATPELRGLSAYCYSEADTASVFTQVGSPTDQIAVDGTITSAPPVADPATAAVANCAAVWAIDLFGTGTLDGFESRHDDGPSGESPAPAGPPAAASAPASIPRLQACLRPDGVYAVFPVLPGTTDAADPDAFCAAVGLAPPYAP